MEVSGRLYIYAALPPGREPLYPVDRRLVGPPKPVLTLWIKEIQGSSSEILKK
jgi:hypothetical protein